MDKFEILGKIGEGAFASVYRVKRIDDGNIYAMKRIKIIQQQPKQIKNTLNEIRILASVNSPYVINYKEAFYEQKHGSICLVTQFAEGGDLSYFIKEKKKKKSNISQNEIWKFAIQMVVGLKDLHQMKVVHRDIKPANILLTKNKQSIKLGDMNVSTIAKNGLARTQAGTPFYASPQIWLDNFYNYKCDIWSMGCVLYEMCCSRPPFAGNDLNSLMKNVVNGQCQRIPSQYSNDLQKLIRLCLTKNQKYRPQAYELLKNNLLTSRFHLVDGIQKYLKGDENINPKLLATILPPLKKNFKSLKHQLPKSNYNTEISNNNSMMTKKAESIEKLPSINRVQSVSRNRKYSQDQSNRGMKLNNILKMRA